MKNDDIFRFFGRLAITRNSSKSIKETLFFAGRTTEPEIFIGKYVIGSFIFGFVLSLFLNWWSEFFTPFYWFVNSIVFLQPIVVFVILLLICEILSFLSLGILIYVFIQLNIETRTKAVEAVLPDFLMYVSSNVSSGMPLDQSIWYAAKPEFGLLSEEVKKSMKKAFSGQPLDDSLDLLSHSFKSDLFNRTMLLIKQSIATGSEISEVLDRTAKDTRESLSLRKEIESSLVLYEIFVIFAAAFGTPFLFAVSTKLVTILEKVFTRIPSTTPTDFYAMVSPSSTPVLTSGEFFWFTMGVLLITSFFSSLIMGVIKTGSKNQGFKFFPILFIVSLLVYNVVLLLLDLLFTNML
jgi:archaellum biogenesis protein FlaJ (TadC family)